MNLVFFDMEGPLSVQDNAYELMKLFPHGGTVFEVVSRYDDLLALEGREGYEPGDTLALIVPFLVYHGIKEEDIERLADRAAIVNGAGELIQALTDWHVFCISTSYEQYARRIAQRVGIDWDNLACTTFAVSRYQQMARQDDFAMIRDAEHEIIEMKAGDDEGMKKRLDRFFWVDLPGTSLGRALQEVKPTGGRRKTSALRGFAETLGASLEQVVAIGDSITDARMLEAVDGAGGMAVAFNGNEYCLPYATIGLASTSIADLEPVLAVWRKGGRDAVKELVRSKEKTAGQGDRCNFHWLAGRRDLDEPLTIHKRTRRIVRAEAGLLG
ncbi:MAG: HAD hydrolase family protein [Chloroflexota bacterium]|nr:HAD hydrolase family protein [Chloroflexota bacterium]